MFSISKIQEIARVLPSFIWRNAVVPYSWKLPTQDQILAYIGNPVNVEHGSLVFRNDTICTVLIYRGKEPTVRITFSEIEAQAELDRHSEAERAKARRAAAAEDFRKSSDFEKWAKFFIKPGDIIQFTGTRSYPLRKVIKHETHGIYGQQLDNSRKEVGMTTTNGYDKISKIWTGKSYEPIRKVYEACK